MDRFQEEVIERLDRFERMLLQLVDQRVAKAAYTTAEAGEILGKAEYTVREWCRQGKVEAKKAPNGRGWLISHDELTRLRNNGNRPAEH